MGDTIRSRLATLLVAVPLLGACDSPVAPPELTHAQLAGSYAAETSYGSLTLTTTADGVTTNWLAAGARVELELRADGSTAGRLYIPGADKGGADMDESLAGSWTLKGTTIQLAHEADTFLRDMPLTVHADRLEGDSTFGGVRVRLVLVRR